MLTLLRNLLRRNSSSLRRASQYSLAVTDSEIINRRPDGITEHVRFADLSAVFIETNDRGPFEPDVWWRLVGEPATGCVFPQGAGGEDDVLDRLLKLPEFDHAAFAEAMTSTQNRKFLCWQRRDG
jgi:hypothetical protein